MLRFIVYAATGLILVSLIRGVLHWRRRRTLAQRDRFWAGFVERVKAEGVPDHFPGGSSPEQGDR
jgi:hypothetical protein